MGFIRNLIVGFKNSIQFLTIYKHLCSSYINPKISYTLSDTTAQWVLLHLFIHNNTIIIEYRNTVEYCHSVASKLWLISIGRHTVFIKNKAWKYDLIIQISWHARFISMITVLWICSASFRFCYVWCTHVYTWYPFAYQYSSYPFII